jgi:hypothetical protein
MITEGAGSEMRKTLGTAVFSGMLGVTLFGIFLTPVFYYCIQWFSDQRSLAQDSEAGDREPGDDNPPAPGEPANGLVALESAPHGNGVAHGVSHVAH